MFALKIKVTFFQMRLKKNKVKRDRKCWRNKEPSLLEPVSKKHSSSLGIAEIICGQ